MNPGDNDLHRPTVIGMMVSGSATAVAGCLWLRNFHAAVGP